YKYLQPALGVGLIEMTIPEKPRSSKQSYRITTLGEALLSKQTREAS
ncbi:MAG: ATP-dependent DNA helicase, partial [Dehalococcoidia bacterium]|nr:ATP-dependent DNA helicase [Dehalococcoidia bacterium]